MNLYCIVAIYLFFINLAGLFSMGIDKWKARNQRWRISEKTLFLLAILGGSMGSITGMLLFRHKTRHQSFRMGMPLLFIIQITLLILLLKGFFL